MTRLQRMAPPVVLGPYTPPGPPSPGSGGTIVLGGRTNYDDLTDEAAFITSIGGNPADSFLLEYLSLGTWADCWDTYGGFTNFGSWTGPKMISLPVQVSASPLTWTDITGGGQDAALTAFFTWCYNTGKVQYIRPGWEGNLSSGTWPWSTSGADTSGNQLGYVAVWQYMWEKAHAVAPGYFKWVWCPDFPGGGPTFPNYLPGGAYYPGDAYVDGLGLDVYWTWAGGGGFPGDASMLAALQSGSTPNWDQILAYCVAHDKDFWVPEWGLNGDNSLPNGGDDPTAVLDMFSQATTAANQLAPNANKLFLGPWNNVGAYPFSSFPNALAQLGNSVGVAVDEGYIAGPVVSTLEIVTPPPQSGVVGNSYELTLTATGGAGGYTFTAAPLPGGLFLVYDTVIDGTFTAAGTVTVDIEVTDADGNTSPSSFVFTVTNPDSGAAVPTVPSGTAVPTNLILNSTFESPGTTTLSPNWSPYWGANGNAQKPNTDSTLSSLVSLSSAGVNLGVDGTSCGLICTAASGQADPFTFTPSPSAPVFVEYKAYIPCESNGTVYNWPALWIVTPDIWNGEIDMGEGLGGGFAGHYHFNEGNDQGALSTNAQGSYSIIPNADNVFGLLFANNGVATLYINGVRVGTFSPPILSASTLAQTNGFMLVVENSGGDAETPGIAGPANNSAVMVLRYARVWQ